MIVRVHRDRRENVRAQSLAEGAVRACRAVSPNRRSTPIAIGSALVLLTTWSPAAAADELYVIPFDVDPQVQVDANLDDWDNIPNPIPLDRREQATYGQPEWSGPEDLRGLVRVSWRQGGISLAAEVIDDVVAQPYTAGDIYNGDHVNLFLDFTPAVDPARNAMGTGQYHLAISPGGTNSGERALPAEVYSYVPEGASITGCEVASRRTANGYIVEAFIPSSVLGDFVFAQDRDLNFTVALSDADSASPKQQTMMTPTTRPWVYGRHALVPTVLGDGNGKGTLPPRAVPIAEALEIPAGKKQEVTFEAGLPPAGKTAHLFLKARIPWERPAGYYPGGLILRLNDQAVTGDRLSNRPPFATMMRGDHDRYVYDDGRMALWYAPDFEAVDSDPLYGLIDNVRACEYEFRLDGLLKEGRNTLILENASQPVADNPRTAILGNLELRIKQLSAAGQLKPAPTGPLPVYEPKRASAKCWSDFGRTGLRITYTLAGERFEISSRFSTPDGRWNETSNAYYELERTVVEQGEWIEVKDTFRNLTRENVPIIQEHACDLKERIKSVWLACSLMPTRTGQKMDAGNPSVFAATRGAGLGLVALNDEFRVHNEVSSVGGRVMLADRQFVLRPGATYTAEFAVFPIASTDLWDFVNAARRMLDVNFQIDIAFAFMFHTEPVYQWTDQMFRQFIENKSVNFIVQSNDGSRYKGMCPYSTSFQKIPHQYYMDMNQRLRAAFPDRSVKHGIYYHCFIDNFEGNEERFADARVMDSGGGQVNYGGAHTYDKIFVPTTDNAFGKETGRNIDLILDQIGADGIFWDEFEFSRTEYTYNDKTWDGCSADIDPNTFRIVRLKGSLSLLSLPWRVEEVRRIMAHGPFIINGAPFSRTMIRLKFPAFTETGSIGNCRRMLLHTPIALGDHITERTFKDAYGVMMRALDQGCLYAWYGSNVIPTHKTLVEHMYPFTPVELHEGYVIGRERILTNRSGLFGWGDSAAFDAYVFDRDGRPTQSITVAKVERDGKAYAEVRIPEGYSMALVRRAH